MTCSTISFIDIIKNYVKANADQFKIISEFADDHIGESRTLPKWPFIMFYIGGMLCLGCSATFHLFSCHEQLVKQTLNRLDYGGICFLIAGSCYPPYYYYLYCNFGKYLVNYLAYAKGYLIFMSVFGLIVILVSMLSYFDKPQYMKFKGMLFLFYGISAAIALCHVRFFP